MARVPYVDPETAAPEVKDAFALVPPLHIFRLVAHAETAFRPFMRFGASILGKQQLSGKLRELAILRVARRTRAEYEWVQHVPIAKAVGVADAQIEALARDDDAAPCFDETERLVLRFTDEVVRDTGASESTFRALAQKLSSRELVELVLAIGFYTTVAMVMRSFEIDLEPAAGTKVIDSIR